MVHDKEMVTQSSMKELSQYPGVLQLNVKYLVRSFADPLVRIIIERVLKR